MAKIIPIREHLVQVKLFEDGVFDPSDLALVKPDGSAWIDRETGRETSFRWQEVARSDRQ
jgi:predicted flap endonuclease-1-like 5' DNA nuclease